MQHETAHSHGSTGEDPHAAHSHIVPVSSYIKVFATLMILWVLTSACARLDLDARLFHGAGFAVCFAIAFTKAVLIVLIFMHVKYSSKVTWVFATASFLWLGILFAITFADYQTRGKVVPDETPARPILPAQEIPSAENQQSGMHATKAE